MNSLNNNIPSGLLDSNWELLSNDGFSLYLLTEGHCIPFDQWPSYVYRHYRKELFSNARFVEKIKKLGITIEKEMVKKYCIIMYGKLDNVPDYNPKTGESNPENWPYSYILNPDPSKEKQKLTPRQKEICIALISGKPDKQITDELNIAETTIIAHKRNIFKKLGVRNKVELANKILN